MNENHIQEAITKEVRHMQAEIMKEFASMHPREAAGVPIRYKDGTRVYSVHFFISFAEGEGSMGELASLEAGILALLKRRFPKGRRV